MVTCVTYCCILSASQVTSPRVRMVTDVNKCMFKDFLPWLLIVSFLKTDNLCLHTKLPSTETWNIYPVLGMEQLRTVPNLHPLILVLRRQHVARTFCFKNGRHLIAPFFVFASILKLTPEVLLLAITSERQRRRRFVGTPGWEYVCVPGLPLHFRIATTVCQVASDKPRHVVSKTHRKCHACYI